jgi:serine/threonine protein kinase
LPLPLANAPSRELSVPLIHNYNVVEKLGQGAFSVVFKGKSVVTGKEVAIKVSKDPEQRLKHESKILAYLNRERVTAVPTLYWYGTYGSNSCLATTLYRAELKPVQELYKALTLCSQIISGLQAIHCAGIVHSDIKPDNFMLDDRGRIQIIDFGLSSLIYNRDKGLMRENIMRSSLVGSCKYASYNLHMGNSPSFRDDLISAGYVMMWLQGIVLPWSKGTFGARPGACAKDFQLDACAKGTFGARPGACTKETLLPLAETLLGNHSVPLYHIEHPENIERAKHKHIDNLLSSIESKHLRAYFNAVYELKYEELPKYVDYNVIFSTLL